MSNITFSLDDALLRKARVAAAKMDVSLNAVVRTLLAGFAESVVDHAQQSGNYQKLLEFSLGKVSYRKLVRDLAIESDEQLFLLMTGAGLPMPSLPEERTAKMVEDFHRVLQRVGI